MSALHRELAAGRWQQMTLIEQMANIGSEVERVFHWRKKNDFEGQTKAFERALELIDLTLESPSNRFRLKEIARTREMFVGIIYGATEYLSSENWLREYFLQFACALRKNV